MFPELTAVKPPLAIRPEYVVDHDATFIVQQQGKGLSSGKFAVFQPDGKPITGDPKINSNESLPSHTIMYVDGKFGSLEAKRSFCDASGLPLFDLYHKFARVTWYVELPGKTDTAIARLSPRASILKDNLEVTVKNLAANGEETTLHVQGQDIWKQRTNVFLGEKVVMTAKRTDKWSVYVPGKKLEWQVDIATGFDIALASVIVVVLAANMYDSSMQSS